MNISISKIKQSRNSLTTYSDISRSTRYILHNKGINKKRFESIYPWYKVVLSL